MPTFSDAIKEAYASAPAYEINLHTVELRHPTLAEPIRVVRNFADCETWVALGGAPVEAVLDALSQQARSQVGLVAKLEEGAPEDGGAFVAFIALSFDIVHAPIESIPVPEGILSIDNVGETISTALDDASVSEAPIEVIYRPYLSTDIEGPQMDPPVTFVLSDVKATPFRVTGRIRMLDIGNKAFPSITYTAKNSPGLVR